MSTPHLPAGRSTIVVMGVAGSGKSACGAALAVKLAIDFVDGDDLHPATNVAKMHGGTPLTDEDRWPWLDRVGEALLDEIAHPRGVVVACSALRRRYRDRIRAVWDNKDRAAAGTLRQSPRSGPVFIFLDITEEEARRRLANRPGHFMPVSLVESQFATLERPAPDEADTVTIPEIGEVEDTVVAILAALAAMSRP